MITERCKPELNKTIPWKKIMVIIHKNITFGYSQRFEESNMHKVS